MSAVITERFDLRDFAYPSEDPELGYDYYEPRVYIKPFELTIPVHATIAGTGYAKLSSRLSFMDHGTVIPVYPSFAYPTFKLGEDSVVAIVTLKLGIVGGPEDYLRIPTMTVGGSLNEVFEIRPAVAPVPEPASALLCWRACVDMEASPKTMKLLAYDFTTLICETRIQI